MNERRLLTLIFLLFVMLLLIGWGSKNGVREAREDPSGTYIAFVPRFPTGERTVIMALDADAAKKATMAIDTQDGTPPSVEQGTWVVAENGDVTVLLGASTTLRFGVAPDVLVAREPDAETWGRDGLVLARAALPLATEWRWTETERPDGTRIVPEAGKTFVVRLGSDLRFTVTGDCNTIAGMFSLRRGSLIAITDLVSTKMFCEGSQEPLFLEDFANSASYAVKKGGLSLIGAENGRIMSFERFAGPLPER